MSAFDGYVQAKFYGGVMAGGPTFTVVHDAETPLRAGYADSIAEFFRVGPRAGTSAHAMVDPVEAIKLLPDNVVAWAAGPKANPRGWHLEQAGYAKFKRADWTTADGLAQLQRVAACLREVHDTWGIPKRWCTDDQLRRAAAGDRGSGGMTTHQQVTRVFPGSTSHTDPEENYPRDLLLEAVLGTAPTPEPLLEDYDMISFVTDAPDHPWWKFDGFRIEYSPPGDPQLLVDLGLAKQNMVKLIAPSRLATYLAESSLTDADIKRITADVAKRFAEMDAEQRAKEEDHVIGGLNGAAA